MLILTVNVGSASVRLGAHEGPRKAFALRAYATLGADAPLLPREGLEHFLSWHGLGRPDAIIHRVVHGGPRLREPVQLDDAVEAELERAAPLAPVYSRRALEWIRCVREVLGAEVPTFLVFDTSFFVELPELAATYALPRELCQEHGIRRYGFHGLAHQSMLRTARSLRPELPRGGRLITMQLGAGCSITAMREGRPIDTSTGFSPLEGLVMSTRPGDVDAGVVLSLLRDGVGAEELARILYERSGLRGLSGTSGDVRDLQVEGTRPARFALEVFAYRARKYLGAYLAALGGADGILIGGGVGEHAPELRAAILTGLEALGITLDPEANAHGAGRPLRISAPESRVPVHVVAVDEALEMLHAAEPLLARSG